MMQEGSVSEDLSYMENRKPPTYLWIPWSTRERWHKDTESNWHSTDD